MLDFLDDVFGPIRDVYGFAANQVHRYPAEDIVTGTFAFESGVQGVGTWRFIGHDRRDVAEIVGTCPSTGESAARTSWRTAPE